VTGCKTKERTNEGKDRMKSPNRSTPKHKSIHTAEVARLKAAAEAALAKGWYVFPCPERTKKTFKGSHGSRDAKNTRAALSKWNAGVPANPAV
jgi:hypothetical protein